MYKMDNTDDKTDDNVEKSVEYGWYSEKQLKRTNRLFYYKDIYGNTVKVTMISNKKHHGCFDDDITFVGVMGKFIKVIKS